MALGFAYWRSPTPSGGNTYDAELIAELGRQGVDLAPVSITAGLNDPRGVATELAAALSRADRWLMDAIVAVAAVEPLPTHPPVTLIVHHFAADDPSLGSAERHRQEASERAALTRAAGLLCSSRWAAHQLERRYGLSGAAVALPGVHPAPPATGTRPSGPPRLLCVGSLTPLKDQLCLVRALERLRDLPWTARMVGSTEVDPAYAAVVRRAVDDAGLRDRIVPTGALTGTALEREWAASDLLVHMSHSETYGLVVTEALARGIPAVVSAGTGLPEALQAGRADGAPLAGAVVAAGRPAHLAAALRGWLTDSDHAGRWRAAALDQRLRLPRWSATAGAVRSAVGSDPAPA